MYDKNIYNVFVYITCIKYAVYTLYYKRVDRRLKALLTDIIVPRFPAHGFTDSFSFPSL